ncbi:fimbria/pilus periplasmic chaperone, partial [Salmonella enterica subsp. enterica serovar Infantis]
PLLGLTGWYGPVQAAFTIDRTLIIFASEEVAQSLTLSNYNTTPMLLQVGTDAGNIAASPDNSTTPLVALPPVFKMQP